MNIFRQLLHCKRPNSDKVYIVEVNDINKNYIVTATWGQREAPRLCSQIKYEGNSLLSATSMANKLIRQKMNGKDAYKKVEAGLIDIPGFKPKNISAAEVHVASNTQADYTLNLHVNRRKLRV